jgi:hypothetical protein
MGTACGAGHRAAGCPLGRGERRRPPIDLLHFFYSTGWYSAVYTGIDLNGIFEKALLSGTIWYGFGCNGTVTIGLITRRS